MPRARGRASATVARCSRRHSVCHDYGDDDEFYHYLARVELSGGAAGQQQQQQQQPRTLRVELRADQQAPAVLLTAACGGATAYLAHADAAAPSLSLQDDGAWPIERSRQRGFSLSSSGDADAAFSLVLAPLSLSSSSSSSSRLTLCAAARGLEVVLSSDQNWGRSPGDSPDWSWQAAALTMVEQRRWQGDDDDDDAAARGTRALVLRPPPPGEGWRSFAADVPVVVSVRLPSGRWHALRGTVALERRRHGAAVMMAGGGGSNPVAAAARRRRAFARALASPPWLMPW
jgi:hypothetical protein